MKHRSVVWFACGTLVSGCTAWTGTFPSNPPVHVQALPTRNAALAAFLPTCPVTKSPEQQPRIAFLAPIAVAATSAAINALTTAINNYIQKTKSDLTATYMADGADILLNQDGSLANHCLIIVNGQFGPQLSNPGDPGALDPTILSQIGLSSYPKLYLEFWITSELIGKDPRILFEPRLLQFAKTEAKNPGNGIKDINILLTIAHEPSGANAGSSAGTPSAGTLPSPGSAASSSRLARAEPTTTASSKPAAPTSKPATTQVIPFEFPKVQWGTFTKAQGSGLAGNPFYSQRRLTTVADAGPLNLHAIITETGDFDSFTEILISTLPQETKSIDDALVAAIQKGLGGSSTAKTTVKK